jgi:hypothetical protein
VGRIDRVTDIRSTNAFSREKRAIAKDMTFVSQESGVGA